MSSKLIVVLGATGNQGGSVIKTFLDDPAWRIRALTRNASSASAQRLQQSGVEVVQADLDDPASLEAAFQDANTIFAVTDFWNSFASPENRSKKRPDQPMNEWTYHYEKQQGMNVFDAAAKVPTLDRLIFSSLSDVSKRSNGKYKNVMHFDSKAHAAEYGRKTHPELWKKTSLIQIGWYISNFLSHPLLQPRKTAEGTYQFISGVRGDVHLPVIAAEEDAGPATRALALSPPGKNLIAYREWMTLNELSAIWGRVLGVSAEVVTLPEGESIPGVPDELKDELLDNWAYFNEFGYEGRGDPTVIHPRQVCDSHMVVNVANSYSLRFL
ncbi:putative hscarg dehydrogenase [Aspergillus steynii IBT 23096]|uniref:Putative hscarg dehydrogenase n=1 Tax=Aspergillus steynii IBT 23096 TaxID=1392250 RepID=A0A2I2G3E6_9EURO|nr:putative hscarg dehydrogenase [Aspergillus steynii IBT 23096]PLB47401.1 putative hscarg dehydrogenase [Aspergillus steynii IBT 23096]